jgi:hypothetical protein
VGVRAAQRRRVDLDDDAAEAGGAALPALARAWLWMQYHDLAGYILLGDPAAQVPTAQSRVVLASLAASARSTAGARDGDGAARAGDGDIDSGGGAAGIQAMEAAVLRRAAGEDAVAIARDLHVAAADVDAWHDTYTRAGRAALAALDSARPPAPAALRPARRPDPESA